MRPHHATGFIEAHPPGPFLDTALVVCQLGILPRKELYECWEVAKCVHSHFPERRLIADLAAGHGLLAWMLLLLGRGSGRRAVCVDQKMPPSAETLTAAFSARFPDLAQSHAYVEGDLALVEADSDTLLTALHACGKLTDSVLALSIRAQCAAAVMPCCHSLRNFNPPAALAVDAHELKAAVDKVGPVAAIDGCRLELLRLYGYDTATRFVDPRITPYNKLLLATPSAEGASGATPELPEAPVAAAMSWHERTGVAPPAPIRVFDTVEIEAIKGRRPVESKRSIEISCWVDDATVLNVRTLARLARRACLEQEGGAWYAEEEAIAAFEADGVETPQNMGSSGASGGEGGDGEQRLPSISAELCDEYTDPGSGRISRSYRIVFASSEEWRQTIDREQTVIWQRRIRGALEARAAKTRRFELR